MTFADGKFVYVQLKTLDLNRGSVGNRTELWPSGLLRLLTFWMFHNFFLNAFLIPRHLLKTYYVFGSPQEASKAIDLFVPGTKIPDKRNLEKGWFIWLLLSEDFSPRSFAPMDLGRTSCVEEWAREQNCSFPSWQEAVGACGNHSCILQSYFIIS